MAVLALSSCARLPAEIAELNVSDAYYRSMSCPQLGTARSNLRRELRLAGSRQSQYVGIVFPPAEYKRNTERIAEIKGELAAIDRALGANGCLASRGAVTAEDDEGVVEEEDEGAVEEEDAGIEIGAEDL
ncbi:MAG TPA: hypothetical protein VHG92_00855 [Afifellaceae bacterium]|nr:hypothetical protein [Afifellaceae bacterium]